MLVFDVGEIYLVSSLCSFVFSSVDGFLLLLEHISVNKSVKMHWSNLDSPPRNTLNVRYVFTSEEVPTIICLPRKSPEIFTRYSTYFSKSYY